MKGSLEKLILSLTRGERRSFSLAAKKNESSEYYKLFNSLSSNSNSKVAVHEKKSNTTIQTRKYLYDIILESLIKKDDNPESEIFHFLLRTETLYHKFMIKEAWNEATKAELLAKKYERYGLLIEVISWKKRINLNVEVYSEEESQDLENKMNIAVVNQGILLKTIDQFQSFLKPKQDFKSLLMPKDFRRLNPDSNSVSFRTTYYYNRTLIIYYLQKREYESCYKITSEMMIGSKEALDLSEIDEIGKAHLESCFRYGDFKEIKILFKKYDESIKNLDKNNPKRLDLYSFVVVIFKLMSYSLLGELDLLKSEVTTVESSLPKWSSVLPKKILLSISFSLFYAYFILGDNKKFRKYINIVLNEERKFMSNELFEQSVFQSLIGNIDRGDIGLLIYNLNALQKHFVDFTDENKFQFIFLQACKNYAHQKITLNELCSIIIDVVVANRVDRTDGVVYSDNYQIFFLWAKSKLDKESLITTIEKWNRGYYNLVLEEENLN